MPTIRVNESLKVAEVFYSVQFEGPFTGTPAIFVRLSGCNLSCKFCDTVHSKGQNMSLDSIVTVVDSKCPKETEELPLVVLTGGEPTIQRNMSLLVEKLFAKGYKVQLETNGTNFPKPYKPDVLEKMFIVCSPKKESTLHVSFMQYVDAFKILVDRNTSIQDVVLYAFSGKMVYLQPVEEDSDETNQNVARTLSLAKKLNLSVSIQVHKLIGVK